MTLGDRIKELASDNSMTIKNFYDALGVSKPTIRNYIAGNSTPNGSFLIDLSSKIGVSPTWLLLGKGPKYIPEYDQKWLFPEGGDTADFISIPRFDIAASAGHGALAESEISTGHYAFNRAWLNRRGLNPATLAVIAVRGDSMEPELYDQDLILLDQSKKEPNDGDMYVVRYFDELFVKRIQKIPDRRFQLHSTNRFYESIEVKANETNDLTFIGKVVASMHEW